MYLVKKFCKMVGVNYSTLRHFERIGLLNPHQDEENGYRNYTLEEAFQVNTFKYYRSLGYNTKESMNLVQNPDKDYVRNKLLERETEIVYEMVQIRNQMKAVQKQLEEFNYMNQESAIRIGKREDLWFLPVSSGCDFEAVHNEEVAAWVKYLPLTRHSKRMPVSNSYEERENNAADFGISIEAKSVYLLTNENLANAIFIQGGECIFYYSTKITPPYMEADIYKEIQEYLEDNSLEIYGDIYIEGHRIVDECGMKGQIVSINVRKKTV